ncbi:acyl carrier protein [Lentzea sp. NPDC005914]|uniref:acyl carrier protein n=1 Tax=Lentzea sp. NPDC005914 TaxID=3154572 RepID=UPI0033F713B9
MDAHRIEALVRDTVTAVLSVDPATLTPDLDLAALPTFSSFRIVTILERVEDALGVEVDADELTPDNLHRLDTLCALFLRAKTKVA